jgi:predicted MFS family arabinose efflux permease
MGQSDHVSPRHTSFADVVKVKEFRWLWIARVQSQVGDQLARVALSVLVFERTHSPLETALVYALTFAPAVVGAVTLSWLADRLPRRSVMVGCDAARAVLLALMAIPNLPTLAVSALVITAVLVGAPFSAAQIALLPELLGDRYVAGSGLRMVTDQLSQVLGFALGGVAVSAIGADGGLVLDAGTFAVSAIVIRWVLPRAAASSSVARDPGGTWRSIRSVSADPRLRVLLVFGWLAAFYIVPEAVAAPYARSLGSGAAAVGLLMASIPAGGALGALILIRWVPESTRPRLMAPLAAASGLALVGCWAHPGLGVSALLWVLSGAASSYQVVAAATFVAAVPNYMRGRAVGLASSGLVAIQGAGSLAGGLIGEHISIARVVALAGLAGAVVAVVTGLAWRRAQDLPGSALLADSGAGHR